MPDEKQGAGEAFDPEQPIPYQLTQKGWAYESPKKRARPEKAPRRREVRP